MDSQDILNYIIQDICEQTRVGHVGKTKPTYVVQTCTWHVYNGVYSYDIRMFIHNNTSIVINPILTSTATLPITGQSVINLSDPNAIELLYAELLFRVKLYDYDYFFKIKRNSASPAEAVKLDQSDLENRAEIFADYHATKYNSVSNNITVSELATKITEVVKGYVKTVRDYAKRPNTY